MDEIQGFELIPQKKLKTAQCEGEVTNGGGKENSVIKTEVGPCGDGVITRTNVELVKWENCIICQKVYDKKRIKAMHSLTTDAVAKSIVNEWHSSGRNFMITWQDLIKRKAMYHKSCKGDHDYKTKTAMMNGDSSSTNAYDQALTMLVNDIDPKLKEGTAFQLSDLLILYHSNLSSLGVMSPGNYRSHSLKQKLQKHYGGGIRITHASSVNASDLVFSSSISVEDMVKTKIEDVKHHEEDTVECEMELGNDEEATDGIYHAAKQIRGDIQNSKVKGIKIRPLNIEDLQSDKLQAIIPHSLASFILHLTTDKDTPDAMNKDELRQVDMLSQDIVTIVSKGQIKTPKQVALGMALQDITGSKDVIRIVNRMNHCSSYDEVKSIDTHMAIENIAKSKDIGVIIPPNIQPGSLVQASADNLDFCEDTLDGKFTTHATTMILIQRKNPETNMNDRIYGDHRVRKRALENPDSIQPLTKYTMQQIRPLLKQMAEAVMIERDEDLHSSARLLDLAWMLVRLCPTKIFSIDLMQRETVQKIPSWSGFNALVSTKDAPLSEIGYCPILNSSSTEGSTIFTILKTLQKMMSGLGQASCIITFDLAIYSKAKTIQWENVEEFDNVIIRLGGFHIALNFLSLLGKKYDGSGLEDLFIDSEVYGGNTASAFMKGKHYKKSVRGHKLALEALTRLLWESFSVWLTETSELELEDLTSKGIDIDRLSDLINQCNESVASPLFTQAVESLLQQIEPVLTLFKSFTTEFSDRSHLFSYWVEYIEMVQMLLDFIRAERDADWKLHLSSVASMVPYFIAMDRHNYSRWLPVYLHDMKCLETKFPDVHSEFMAGNFPVAHTTNKFNQVWSDLALEQSVNRDAKTQGGLKGLTKNPGALQRWFLTRHQRAVITNVVKSMCGLENEKIDENTHEDLQTSRIIKDEKDVKQLLLQIKNGAFINPFDTMDCGTKEEPTALAQLASGTVLPLTVSKKMINAKSLGEDLFRQFMQNRMSESTRAFWSSVPRQQIPTFSSHLSSCKKKASDSKDATKIDRDILNRALIMSQKRSINVREIMKSEMTEVPHSLAYTDGSLRKTDKAALMHGLEEMVDSCSELPTAGPTAHLIDMWAFIHAKKAAGAKHFGELAARYYYSIVSNFNSSCKRVDVVDDNHDFGDASIKAMERRRRGAETCGHEIRINGPKTPVPVQWERFLSNPRNKSALSVFLYNSWCEKAEKELPEGCTLHLSPGNKDKPAVRIKRHEVMDIQELETDHEEADTKLVVHAYHASFTHERVIVDSPDTDVLVLCLHHADKIPCEIWFKTGTGENRRYIPVHTLAEKLGTAVCKGLPACHALTGTDTTSSLAWIGKKSSLTLLKEDQMIQKYLSNLGSRINSSKQVLLDCEKFVCHLYTKNPDAGSNANDVRYWLFCQKQKKLEHLPPTTDSLIQHIKRANYQAYIWKHALERKMSVPAPEGHGWKVEDSKLVPVLMTQPAAPKALVELVTCKCGISHCDTNRCQCRKNELPCTDACVCMSSECCKNPYGLDAEAL